MRKDSWFRGPLLSALSFTLLIGGAPGMVTAQNSDPSGNTTCDDNGNCASDGNTVNAGNNGSGTPGASNPHSNPLGGDLTGGMNPAPPVHIPTDLAAVGNYYKRHQAAQALKNLCNKVEGTNTLAAVLALGASILAAAAVAIAASGGTDAPLVIGGILAVGAMGLAGHAALSSWCSNEFSSWYSAHFG